VSVQYQIKFITVQILGDNLGLNEVTVEASEHGNMLDDTANVYVLVQLLQLVVWCQSFVYKQSTSKFVIEDQTLFRNTDNYAARVLADSGIKHSVIWNETDGFHVTKNWEFDVMHDMLEGVCDYDMHNVTVSTSLLLCTCCMLEFRHLTMDWTRVLAT